MTQGVQEKGFRHRMRSNIECHDIPDMNPQDLIDPIVEAIVDVDPHAEYIVMIADPRDHQLMSIRTCLHEPIKGRFLRTLIEGLWPADEDRIGVPMSRLKMREIEEKADEQQVENA